MVRFGPFTIDPRTWTLTRGGQPVDLSPRLVEILAHLAAQDGAIVTKDELLDRFWPETHVTENTLTRAIADIRKAIDDHADHPQFIQTMARRGYRFVGVQPAADSGEGSEPDPLRQWVEGRLALESLDGSRLAGAARAFEQAAAAMPNYAPAHAGVANAHLVRFETTRQRNVPDRSSLERALASARQACAIDPRLAEGWAVLGHALVLSGQLEDARAAVLRAVSLEPGNWRHQFRLALASWGEERLRAVDRTLGLMPGCAAAHLLSTMVFIARGALDLAARAAEAGARLQEQQPESATLPGAGLHWITGLVHAAGDDMDAAAVCFAREAAGSPERVYAREFVLNAHVALGFLGLHRGDRASAADRFRAALDLQPGHARAIHGLALCGSASSVEVHAAIAELDAGGKVVEAVLVRVAVLGAAGAKDEAIALLGKLVEHASPGPAGWSLRADPLFLPLRQADSFASLVSIVAARAA